MKRQNHRWARGRTKLVPSSPNLDDTHLTLKMVDCKMERKSMLLINFLPASVAWADSVLCLLRSAYVRNRISPMTLAIGCLQPCALIVQSSLDTNRQGIARVYHTHMPPVVFLPHRFSLLLSNRRKS